MRSRRTNTPAKRPASVRSGDTPQTERSVEKLQRQLGNRTLQKLLEHGAEVSEADHPREREARAVANEGSNSTIPSAATDSHPLDTPGAALDPALRQLVERRVGHDLRGVRVHSDATAAEAAEALGANAFTIGSDIVFGRGKFDPQSTDTMRLLTHEAAHTGASQSQPTIFRDPAQDLVDAYDDLGNDALGAHLATLARSGRYSFAAEVIGKVGYFSRDDVSLAMLNALTIPQLISIARHADGQSLLRTARSEIAAGWESGAEADKGSLIDAVTGDVTERFIWNRHRIQAIKEHSPSDLESLARIFEDDQIVDDGSVQSRLEVILSATEHLIIPGLQTGIEFSDTGFRGDRSPTGAGFRDPHPSSQNQVGHFLTAVGLFFNPGVVSRTTLLGQSIREMVGAPAAMSNAEVALRLTIGHEKAPDPPGGADVALEILFTGLTERFLGDAPEGETDEQRDERVGQAVSNETERQIRIIIAAFRRQFEATTDADVAAWNETLSHVGADPAANVTAIEGPDAPLNRIAVDPTQRGNSRQDLRLSLMGWKLGQMIRAGEFAGNAAVASWIRANLGAAP